MSDATVNNDEDAQLRRCCFIWAGPLLLARLLAFYDWWLEHFEWTFAYGRYQSWASTWVLTADRYLDRRLVLLMLSAAHG